MTEPTSASSPSNTSTPSATAAPKAAPSRADTAHADTAYKDTAHTHTAPSARLIHALLLLALAFGLLVWRAAPPAPRADAPGNFSAQRAGELLERLIGDLPAHPVDSPESAILRQRLVDHLRQVGLEPEVQDTWACRESQIYSTVSCARVRNVLTRLPGRESGPAVLLLAHYDSVGAGPGAADDGAGIAAVLEVARLLAEEGPRRHPVVVLLSDAEENGLLGARAFLAQHPWAANVAVVLNVEARGTGGRSLLFETSDGNAALLDAYRAAEVRDPAGSSLYYEIYRLLPNDTDLTVFKRRGIAGMNFAFAEGLARYHTPRDDLEHLDLGSLQHHGDNLLAVTRELADRDLASLQADAENTENAVYGDLLGLTFLTWPARWALPLGALLLSVLVLAATRLLRRRTTRLAAILWGALAWLLGLILATSLGFACVQLALALSGDPAPWRAHPLALRIAVWVAALLGPGIAATLLARRAGYWGLALAPWLALTSLGVGVAAILPGASFHFAVPGALAAVLFLSMTLGRQGPSQGTRDALVIAAALVLASLWMDLARSLETALGFSSPLLIILPLALAFSALQPLFAVADSGRGVRRGILLEATVIMVVAAGIAGFVPTASEDAPRDLTLRYFEDADQASATWLLGGASTAVPQEVHAVTRFSTGRSRPEPGLDAQAFTASAEPVGMAPPSLEILADTSAANARILRLRLTSPGDTDRLRLLIPQDAAPLSVTLKEDVRSFKEGRPYLDHHHLTCTGASCRDVEVELRVGRTTPFDVQLYRELRGLPETATPLLKARGTTGVPRHRGDVSVVLRRFTLPAASPVS